MKILENHEKHNITAAVFDFDGTLSTLRCGWEAVMEKMMLDILSEKGDFKQEIKEFIDRSTGIQTIFQMKWLREKAESLGIEPLDIWEYKAEYNRLLMERVEQNKQEAARDPQKFLIRGSEAFLKRLKEKGIKIYVASGTDEADVKKEAEVLGLLEYFDDIRGAIPYSESCSKEETLRALMAQSKAENLMVVGDGPVEIKLGKAMGALTLGACANERLLCGYDEAKIRRLTNAGVHALVDGYTKIDEIFAWMEE